MTLLDILPEEAALDDGQARGLVIRVHTLSYFQIEMVAVLEQAGTVTVVRRELNVGPRGIVTPRFEERFTSTPIFLTRLDRQLTRLGATENREFCAAGMLDGVTLMCRHRDQSGTLHRHTLVGWKDSPERPVQRLGDFFERLGRSSVRALRWRAWWSRFW